MSLLNGSPTWMYNAGSNFYPHEINQSLRFNDADTPRLTKTWGQAATDDGTWTISMWVKRSTSSTWNTLYAEESQAWTTAAFYNDTLYVQINEGGGARYIQTNRLFRDFSSWYHIVVAFDKDNSTAAYRLRLYINGTEETSFSADQRSSISSSANSNWNTNGKACAIGARSATNNSLNFDGYIAEFHNIDGQQLTPSAFGETKEGIWIPKEYTGTYGNNGFYLPFDDGSAIGDDESTNTNDWTVTNLVATDVVKDTPTNNFCTFNQAAIDNTVGTTLSEGNLGVTPNSSGGFEGAVASFTLPRTGKWYWEYRTGQGGSSIYGRPSLITVDEYMTQTTNSGEISGGSAASNPNGVLFTANDGGKRTNNADSSHGSAVSSGNIIGNAYNADTGQWYIYINNSIQASGAAISESIKGNLAGKDVYILHERYNGNGLDMYNFGQDSSFAGAVSVGGNADENGYGDFKYAPPSGYLSLCSQNLPDPEIDPNGEENPTDYFNTVLYTGNGGTSQAVTGVGFSPNFLWTKSRSSSDNQHIFDSVRGASTTRLFANLTNAEDGNYGSINSFDSDGFTTGNNTGTNQNNTTYVAWNWKAGGSAVTNNDGTLTSQVSANTDSGFSVVTYSGSNSAGSFGHGLNQAPDFVIIKQRNDTGFWAVGADINGWTWSSDFLQLQSNAAKATNGGTTIFTSAPTSTVVNIGGGSVTSTSGKNLVAYCFHNVEGYQKVGTWEGNGSTNGPYVNCGFKPAFVFMKNIDAAENWLIYDNKRDPFNVTDEALLPNSNSPSGGSANAMDFLSNGFKLRSGAGSLNGSGKTFVFLAIAEQSFKYANAK